MTPTERAKANALGLRANGLSIRQIAERLGVAHGTVADWLRGRGEWYEVRECQLCGDRFVAASGAQRFCSAAHAAKYRRVLGPPTTLERYRERTDELEAELVRLRAQLEGRRAACTRSARWLRRCARTACRTRRSPSGSVCPP
jgi:transcriptional regulator with XRE-family HTH domain